MLSTQSHLTPVHATCLIRATSVSVVRKNSFLQLPATLLSTFCLWNSASPLSIALLTAFDHVDTRFTPLSCHVFRVSPRCALTNLDHECACTSHHSFSHALDDRFHDFCICITCECCSWAAPYLVFFVCSKSSRSSAPIFCFCKNK